MIEDALREAFAAKAGSTPPRSLHGIADVAIRNAGRVRRRRRVAVTGMAAFVVMIIAALAGFNVLTPAAAPTDTIAQDDIGRQPVEPQATLHTQTAPPAAHREVDAIDGQAQPSKTVRIQLPDNGTVAAAYKAKDGYLVVNSKGDGDKQLVLQDDHNKQQVLVKQASDIAVATDGGKVAWAQEGTMTVAARTTTDDQQKLSKQAEADVPTATVPITFVGADLVLGREEGEGFDVWYAGRKYTESWDKSVVRIFGVHPDEKSVYAEIKPADGKQPMCLALLALDQPFKVMQSRCGLPLAAKSGGRVSPDGHWLAYPVEGLKKVMVVDLTKAFTDVKLDELSKGWTLTVTTKTVWLNAATFVVDSGGKFLGITPTSSAGDTEPLNVKSEGVVLVEPLYSG